MADCNRYIAIILTSIIHHSLLYHINDTTKTDLLSLELRDDVNFDCFWLWHDPTPIPVRAQWHTQVLIS